MGRLAAVLLLAMFSFGAMGDKKTAINHAEDAEAGGGGSREPRKDGETEFLKQSPISFLMDNFPLSEKFAEGYKKNIMGYNQEESKDDFLAGQEVAELLWTGEFETPEKWIARWESLRNATIAAQKRVADGKTEEELEGDTKRLYTFYKRFLFGLDFELNKNWEKGGSKEYQDGYGNGRQDKLKFGKLYAETKTKLAEEKLTAAARDEALKTLEKNRMGQDALFGYGQSKFWKAQNNYAPAAEALRMAAKPDAEGRLFLNVRGADGANTAYYMGNRQKDDGSALKLAERLAAEPADAFALSPDPWSKAARRVRLDPKSGTEEQWGKKGTTDEFDAAPANFAAAPFQPNSNPTPDLATKGEALKTILGAQSSCFGCHKTDGTAQPLADKDKEAFKTALANGGTAGEQGMINAFKALSEPQKKALADWANAK